MVASIDRPTSPANVMPGLGFDSFAVVRPPDGHRYLLWSRGNTIVGQRWDSLSSTPSGEITAIATLNGYDDTVFAISASGVMVYGKGPGGLDLQWVDRTGKSFGSVREPDSLISPALSPDQSMVAVVEFSKGNLTVTDVRRHVTSLVATKVTHPVEWSPDGSRLGFTHDGRVVARVVTTGNEEILVKEGRMLTFQGWHPDGRSFLYSDLSTDGKRRIWIKPVDPNGPARRLLNTAYDESQAAISSDGKWLAYATSESGNFEVYAQKFDGGPRLQVSSQGGNMPRWRKDGRELFYQALGGILMSVDVVAAADKLNLSPPHALFPLPGHYISDTPTTSPPTAAAFSSSRPTAASPASL